MMGFILIRGNRGGKFECRWVRSWTINKPTKTLYIAETWEEAEAFCEGWSVARITRELAGSE